ncbi:YheC/YheD family protein [Hazenella sp. IB182357]|uniref:YheC/YheD family protein n=1 Tax=Polycladospora coralii TaxID=2771432 RepID=A0A926RTJ7_9BACL|nr:YheC/YheD family protein [Polycladospora coralii]MBD1372915.1 YheC/YheD family protein [Polycladospora coralii]MBS7531028.1 YheC/YheD family protein [Polycladospora coralii]
MSQTVGILISRRIFRACLQGDSPYDPLDLYDQYARENGLDAVFFTMDHLMLEKRKVYAYRRTDSGVYDQTCIPLPAVIHNRIKPVATLEKFKILQAIPEVQLFNQNNRLDKWTVYHQLSSHPEIVAHLPETKILNLKNFESMMANHNSIYLKPRDMSLGIGVRSLHHNQDVIRVYDSKGGRIRISKSKWRDWIRHLMKHENLLVQQTIWLSSLSDRPFDLRVSVQKNGEGKWSTSGMVAKIGRSKAVATNLAVGGKLDVARATLKAAGFENTEKIEQEIEKVVLKAASYLSEKYPGLADLGFDIAIDQNGRIWIIEVNGRDLRITFYLAKEMESWRKTFATPMAYAAYLLKTNQVKNDTIAILTPGSLPLDGKKGSSVETVARAVADKLSQYRSVCLYGKNIQNINGVYAFQPIHHGKEGYQKAVVRHLQSLQPSLLQIENRPLWINEVKDALLTTKKILFLHSDNYIKPPYAPKNQVKEALLRYDHIITNSQFMKDLLANEFPEIASKVTFVWLGVDIQKFCPPSEPNTCAKRILNRKKLGINGQTVILFTGRMIPKKGVHYLIEAFSRIAKHHPNAILLIAGSSYYGRNVHTKYVQKVKSLARKLGNQICFLPYQPHDYMPEIYQMADMFVNPSPGNEPFGLVNVEAMACGLPILTTQSGGIQEVIQNGINGELLTTDNIVKELTYKLDDWLNHAISLSKKGEESRRIAVENFSWQRVAKDLNQVYAELASKPAPIS